MNGKPQEIEVVYYAAQNREGLFFLYLLQDYVELLLVDDA